MMNRNAFLLCLLICLIVAGCSKNKPLAGTVTFSDGTPVQNGTVFFQNGMFQATGIIKPDGTYRASSERENNGIPPGNYEVFITNIYKPPTPEETEKMITPALLLHPKYENPSTSGLTCKIPAPGNRFDIMLEPRNPSKRKENK